MEKEKFERIVAKVEKDVQALREFLKEVPMTFDQIKEEKSLLSNIELSLMDL